MQTVKKRIEKAVDRISDQYGVLLSPDYRSALIAEICGEVRAKKEKNTCPRDWLMKLCHVCNYRPELISKATWNNLSEAGLAFFNAGIDINRIDDFAEWWYADAWRQKNRVPITLKALQDNWERFEKSSGDGDNRVEVSL